MDKNLQRVIIDGRMDCYVSKTAEYNPYTKVNDDYDWCFEKEYEGYRFSDSYRGFNPYSGVELIYKSDRDNPVWICDYVGYVLNDIGIGAGEVYEFLKRVEVLI